VKGVHVGTHKLLWFALHLLLGVPDKSPEGCHSNSLVHAVVSRETAHLVAARQVTASALAASWAGQASIGDAAETFLARCKILFATGQTIGGADTASFLCR